MEIPVQPMEPILRAEPFEDADFIYQVKWDGIRCLSLWDKKDLLHLWGKKGQGFTSQYPFLYTEHLSTAFPFLLDGELVLLTPEGKPSFPHLMQYHRSKKRKRVPDGYRLAYMVFDLLMLKGEWLVHQPLSVRQSILQKEIKTTDHISIVPSFSEGTLLYEATKEHGIEGIVAKRLQSPYQMGKSHHDWFKIKHSYLQNCVIGGIVWKSNQRDEIRSLLTGAYYHNKLFYLGAVHAGLNHRDLQRLIEETKPLESKECPFHEKPQTKVPITWLTPSLTLRVAFMEWSPGYKMRDPHVKSFLTLSPNQCLLAEEPL